MPTSSPTVSPLDRARAKAYFRLLPLLFLSYAIAYVDRINVSSPRLRCPRISRLSTSVIGFGAGVFFIGYFVLEIPGTLLVEKWSARKWICRIMISWGIMAGLTAFVKTPFQFYSVRFLLGLAEAGFFPGVIVYLTHWFPARDRGRGTCLVLHRHTGRPVRQPQALVLLAPDRHHGDHWRRDGPPPGALGNARLAVDVHRLGNSGGDPGDPGSVLAARLAQGCELAQPDEREALEQELSTKKRDKQGTSPHDRP